ncbi:MAG: rRNA maturation RNase YbeY, partial [Phycisphaerae bacterium]
QIVVSLDRARCEAAARGHDWQREALLYVVHGVLHLLGHDDAAVRRRAAMHRLEDDILIRLGVGPVYDGAAGAATIRRKSPAHRKKAGARRTGGRTRHTS